MNALQLIGKWRDEKVSIGDQVQISNMILAKCDECWLPSSSHPDCDCPEREISVQVIGDIEKLFENMPMMTGEGMIDEGGVLYYFEEATIEGKICCPTIAGYPVALMEITHLSVMSDYGIQYVSGLGKEGPRPRAIKFERDETGQIQATEIECDNR